MPTGWLCGPRLAALREGLADLFLPLACIVCGTLLGGGARSLACPRCWSRVRALSHPQCERCGHPAPALDLVEAFLARPPCDTAGGGLTCRWCLLLPPYVRAARSACWATSGTGGDFVHALKYGGWTRLSHELAERMIRLHLPEDVVSERSAVVAVPLAAVRQRERGYNQSELLARHIAAAWGVPFWRDVLVRARATTTQTRLAPEARAQNVAGAFAVPSGCADRLRGSHLVLVDDVVTTCATLNECAAALYSAGARLISYLTFARAPAATDRS